MMMLELLTIEELAERSGVSIRTIRFYITEGLLPSPHTRGRKAAYTAETLDRLILIQRLKDAHLPLKEIRTQLDALPPERIRQLARQQEQNLSIQSAALDMPVPPVKPDNALNYITRVLEARSAYPASEQKSRFSPPRQASAPKALVKPEPAENWRRIEITPGIELHIREPLDPLTQKKLTQIVEMVKILFG